MFLRLAEEIYQKLMVSDDDGLSGSKATGEDPGVVFLTHLLHEHGGIRHELDSLV